VTATTRTRRSRALVLASAAALALSAVPAAAQEEDPAAPETGVACDAEVFEDEDEGEDFPFYFVEPGETVSCTAFGLDPETDAEWLVEVYGLTEDEFGGDEEDLDLEEPYVTYGSEGPVTPTEDGELTFEFTIPEELIVGGFDGTVWQGDAEDPTYEEFFGGVIFGFFLGGMECDPDPAVRGEPVDCVAELNPGEFEWEVYELSVRDLIDSIFGEDEDADGDLEDFDIEPTASGTDLADGEGFAPFTFTLPVEGDAQIFFAVASQEDAFAFYAGEIVPAEDTEEPISPPVDTEDDGEDTGGPVAVRRPNRVEAGAGGAATEGGTPAGGAALVLGLALTAAVAIRRTVTQGS
jgi:hypothetical protein